MHLHSPTQWRKREVYPISSFFVWTAFKHQVQDLYASWESPVFSSLCRPETHFRYAQGLQWTCTLIGFSFFIQERTFALNRVEHKKSINIAKKFEISIVDFQKSSKTFLITTYKEKSRRRTIIGSKVILHWWSSSIGNRKSDNWKVQANSKNTTGHTSN